MQTLGDALSSIEFSPEEETRLASALASDASLQRKVFRAHAPALPDLRLWRSAQRRYQVSGFRDGNPAARELVVRRLLEQAKASAIPRNAVYWPIYRAAVRRFVNQQHSDLSSLLSTERLREGITPSSTEILSAIANSAPLYRVTIDSVRELYELWGLDRVVDWEKGFASPTVDYDIVRKAATQSAQEICADVRRDILRVETKISQVDSAVRGEFSDLQAEVGRLKSVYEAWHAETSAALSRMTGVGDDRRRTGSSSTKLGGLRSEDLSKSIQALQLDFQERISEQQRRIAKLELRLSSDITASKGARQSAVRAHNYEELASRYMTKLSECGVSGLSAASVQFLVDVVRSSSLFLTDEHSFITAAVEQAGGSETRTICVSPTWLSPSDWKSELEFVSAASTYHRTLVLLDFDSALQEAYLLPGLTMWLDNRKQTPLNRIVLVPAGDDRSQISPRILESCFSIETSSPVFTEITDLRNPHSDAAKSLQTAVSNDFFRLVPTHHAAFEREIAQLAENCGIALPKRLTRTFVDIFSALKRSQEESISGRVAASAVIAPWVRRVRGEGPLRVLSNVLGARFGTTRIE
jgi:hypothetical protein